MRVRNFVDCGVAVGFAFEAAAAARTGVHAVLVVDEHSAADDGAYSRRGSTGHALVEHSPWPVAVVRRAGNRAPGSAYHRVHSVMPWPANGAARYRAAMTSTLHARSVRPDDAAAIAAIYAAIESAEPTGEAFSEQDIYEELTGPEVDLDSGSVAILSDDQLLAFGYLQMSPPAAEWKAWQNAGVHPDHTGAGLGRRILRGLEDRAAAIRDRDAPGRPGRLQVWLDDQRLRTAALVQTAGYQTWRHFFRMRCDLGSPIVAAPVPSGVAIRRYTAADDDGVRLVSNESFADHWGSTPMDSERWRAAFASSAAFRPEHSWIALVDGEPVAFVLAIEHVAETELNGYPTGYLSRVGTARRVRGRGIASALLSATLTGMMEAGYRYAELGVDADSPTGAGRIYERAGFSTFARSRIVGLDF